MTTIAPLTIVNTDLAVSLMIDNAPTSMMIREHIQNAIEAPVMEGEKKRLIRLYSDAGKLVIINSGQGMTDDELTLATNLSSSIRKVSGTDTKTNRGEGAKIASMKFNPLGLRYRSRAGEDIAESTILGQDTGDGSRQWGRKILTEDGQTYESWNIHDDEITAEEKARYADFGDLDFTEVKFMGAEPDQNTAFDPYGILGAAAPHLTVGHDIFNRYYRLPDHALPIRIELAPDFRQGAGWRQFIPIADLVTKHAKWFENLEERFVTLPSGVTIEYLMHRSDSNARSPFSQFSVGPNGNRAAFVFGNEMYDVIDGNKWKRDAVHYGMFGVAHCMSVFIHFPESMKLIDGRYRDQLIAENGERLNIRDFAGIVAANRPQWLLDHIAAQKNATSVSESEKIRESLQKWATQFATKSAASQVDVGSNIVNFPSGNKREAKDETTSRSRTRTAPKQPNAANDVNDSGNGKPNGIPNVVWLDDPTSAGDRLLHRGAMYVQETNDLYVNGQYPMFERIVNEVRGQIGETTDSDRLEGVVRRHVRSEIMMQIAQAVLMHLAKRNTKEWLSNDIQQAISTASLSTAYDLTIKATGHIARCVRYDKECREIMSLNEVAPAALAG